MTLTNEGFTDDASTEVVMQEKRLRLRIGVRRRRVASVAPASLQAKLAHIGVYLTKRLQRTTPQIAVSRPRWDVNYDPTAIVAYATYSVSWADIAGMIEGDEPRMVVVPDQTVHVSIPRTAFGNREQRRAMR